MSKPDRSAEAAERGATVYPYSQAHVPIGAPAECPDCGAPGLIYVQERDGRMVHLVQTRPVAELSNPASWGEDFADHALVDTKPDRIHDCQGPWLGAREAAGRAGVEERTWTGYVARRQAPQHGRRNPETGKKEWTTAAVDEWLGSRPGPGARRDLEARA